MKTCLALALALAPVAFAAESANYSLTPLAFDAGGRSASAGYTLDSSTAPGGGASSTNLTARTGYSGALYAAAGLELSASPLTVNEATTRQLAASLLLDDASLLALAPAAVTWSVQSGPLLSISAGGLATAGIVYQNTDAVAHGSHLTFTDTLTLSVLNVGHDDWQTYAADGIADAWQVQYFGENNAAAAPVIDAEDDGQNNLLEFRAGTVPIDPASRLLTRGLGFSGPDFVLELSRVQPGTRYVFERATDFAAWTDVFTLDPAAVATPFAQALPIAAGGRNLYRVRLTTP